MSLSVFEGTDREWGCVRGGVSLDNGQTTNGGYGKTHIMYVCTWKSLYILSETKFWNKT